MLWFFFGILLSLSWALTPIASRYLMRKGLDPYAFTASFLTLSTVLLFLMTIAIEGFYIDYSLIPVSFLIAVLMYLAGLLWVIATKYEEASYVNSLLQLDLPLVIFLGIFLLNENLNVQSFLGALLILGACIYLSKKGFTTIIHQKKVLLLLAGSVLLAALLKLLIKSYVGENSLFFTTTVMFFRMLIAFAIVLSKKESLSHLNKLLRNKRNLFAVFVRSVFTTTATVSIFLALRFGMLSKVSIISSTSPLFSVLLGGKMLGESKIKIRLFSAIIIVLGSLLTIL
ncbi:hypothetical protein DRN74_01450 [Candidatus Micrarchaeota archaeon]|nr:MAG: hypothetical protein DRN74_01450 [Candidatus Micrarchaeota archaeon]